MECSDIVSLIQKDFLYFLKILLKAARFLNGSLKFVLLFFQVLNGLGFLIITAL